MPTCFLCLYIESDHLDELTAKLNGSWGKHSQFLTHDVSDGVVQTDMVCCGTKLGVRDVVTERGGTAELRGRLPDDLGEMGELGVLRIDCIKRTI